jgi:hypothetical protein
MIIGFFHSWCNIMLEWYYTCVKVVIWISRFSILSILKMHHQMQDCATICDITMECKIDFMLEKKSAYIVVMWLWLICEIDGLLEIR